MTFEKLKEIEERFQNGDISKKDIEELILVARERIFHSKVMETLPSDYRVKLGWEPGVEYSAFVALNSNKDNVFQDSCIEEISEYILFIVVNGIPYAVDGSDSSDAWNLESV